MKLKETIEKYPQTEIWNDSCDRNELKYAIEYGAEGATTNPSIVLGVLKNNFDELRPKIDKMIKEYPSDTEDDIAWRVIGLLGYEGAQELVEIYEKTNGQNGRLSMQVNAKYYKNTSAIMKHALELSSQFENIAIKAPTSKEAIVAFEELTYLGVSINATVCFTVSQAIAVAEAVERGLNRREREGLDSSKITPVCTIMAGRVDDYLKEYIEANDIIVDPEALEHAGVYIGKKVYSIYNERKYKTRLLIAAYRNHYHWSSFIGGNVILTIPYKWQVRYNNSHVEIRDYINDSYNDKYLKILEGLEEFNKAFQVDGLSLEDFTKYGAFRKTMKGFLASYDELLLIIRDCMI